jgi:hypothetical protein
LITAATEMDEDTRKRMLGAVVSYSHALCDAIESGPQPPERAFGRIWRDASRDTDRVARR